MSSSVRIFSIISLLIVVILAVAGGIFFRESATDNLVSITDKNNTAVAQGYINSVWNNYRTTLIPLLNDPAKLKDNPQVKKFAYDTVGNFKGMSLVRINIYSLSGALMMSDNVSPSQKMTGNAASPDPVFVKGHLIAMVPQSQLLTDVALQATPHAKLVQTLVPIINGTGRMQVHDGVVEIISDVTEPWYKLESFQQISTGAVILMFLLFLAMLSLMARKAEYIISKQHEANLELAAAASTAQAESQEKSQFLANISHELRTPLNAIIGFSAEMIKSNVLATLPDPKYNEYIGDINSSGTHLLTLINDILDFSKAEAGKLGLEVSEINITKIIQSCLRLVSPRAEGGGVRLVEDLPKEPIVLLTDNKKFKQVMLNLLSNAVKFTPTGGAVSVTGWHNVPDDTFTFEVRDTGIGIAPKDISRAMSPFAQIDNSLKRKYEGTGLGLPLSKKFVELMGGKFSIVSKVGEGTVVGFTLPREFEQRDGIIIKRDVSEEVMPLQPQPEPEAYSRPKPEIVHEEPQPQPVPQSTYELSKPVQPRRGPPIYYPEPESPPEQQSKQPESHHPLEQPQQPEAEGLPIEEPTVLTEEETQRLLAPQPQDEPSPQPEEPQLPHEPQPLEVPPQPEPDHPEPNPAEPEHLGEPSAQPLSHSS